MPVAATPAEMEAAAKANADVAKFLHHGGVALRIYVAQIGGGGAGEVEIVERTLVAAHIPLVEQVHALHTLSYDGMFGYEVVFGGHHHLVLTARL